MLVYRPGLSVACLEELTGVMIDCGKLSPADRQAAVEQTIRHLAERHGKRIAGAVEEVPVGASAASSATADRAAS
jgi:hypothetical protein